jgi:hypothetical protein
MVEEMVEMVEDIAVEASRAEDITEGKSRRSVLAEVLVWWD